MPAWLLPLAVVLVGLAVVLPTKPWVNQLLAISGIVLAGVVLAAGLTS